jgi:hypothetical protein
LTDLAVNGPIATLAVPALDEERLVKVNTRADNDRHDVRNRCESGMRRIPFARSLLTEHYNLHRIALWSDTPETGLGHSSLERWLNVP